MITEEALPTYMAMINTLDGVRDETGRSQHPCVAAAAGREGRGRAVRPARERTHGGRPERAASRAGRAPRCTCNQPAAVARPAGTRAGRGSGLRRRTGTATRWGATCTCRAAWT